MQHTVDRTLGWWRVRPTQTALIALAAFSIANVAIAQGKSTGRSGALPASDSQSPNSVLRANTQALLDAIAPGDTAVWNRLLDPAAIQVDENDVVRTKPEILASLQPLGPGLVGNLAIDDFKVALHGNVAVVTHEDNEYLDYHGQVIRSRFRMTDTWVDGANGWRLLGSQVLAVQKDPPSIELDHATLCGYNGRYAMTSDITATMQCAGDSLVMKRTGHPDRFFLPEVRDVFFERGQPRTRRIFQRDAEGRITGFADRREERDIVWKRLGS
jgi:hypothetical protein